ncbi:MAG: fasciclin domain-containing protein [Chitinophagaceae bacterium]|nr:fasciclin domain-containing protein [Chitinophagaceae bacterium]
MMKRITVAVLLLLSINFTFAQGDIVAVATASKDHSTLVTAIEAAGLTQTLKGAGPFTLFAPVNAAFSKLPDGELEKLLKNKEALGRILKNHVVSGKWDAATLMTAIKKNNGTLELTTVGGGKLIAAVDGGKVKLTDETGGMSYVTVADVMASNGVIHVIDALVLPK